jgi:arylsulfatase A-like enzyme
VLSEPVIWARADRPSRSVVLVTTDTHRGDHLGSASDSVGVSTPNLDALAARGVQFDTCFTSTNSTNPSHVALMTGQHPRDTGVLSNRERLTASAETLAELFRAAGYSTWASLSVQHLMEPTSGLGQGFERMSGPSGTGQRTCTDTVDDVVRWMPDRDARPLFLWVHLFDPHLPYDPPPERARRYLADRDPRAAPDDPEVMRALYKGEVEYLDSELGRLLALGPLDDAIVAVVGDHGESLGAHGLFWDHAGLYPDSLRVPLILAWEGGPRGVRVADLASQKDLGRTLLDLAGLSDRRFGGRGLLRLLDPAARAAEPHYALHSHWLSVSVTDGGYHLILQLGDAAGAEGARARHSHELYDLTVDPACAVDIAEERPEQARRLRRAAIHWLAGRRDLGWNEGAPLDAEQEGHLAALGYFDVAEGTGSWMDDDCAWCRRFR